MKCCSICKITKPHEKFWAEKRSKDGLRPECKECRYERKRKSRLAKLEYWREKEKKYCKTRYLKDKAKHIASIEKWKQKEPEKFLAMRKKSQAKYKKKNAAKYCALENHRRAAKMNATPSWLTKNQKESITHFYLKAAELTAQTGVKYEVDHIIPLNGESVKGLHVPWNLQIITKTENLKKSNKIEDLRWET